MRVAVHKNCDYASQTKTTSVLEAPRPFGHRITRRLFTAGTSRHDALSRCYLRSLGQTNQWETRVSRNFVSPDESIGSARSNLEQMGMSFLSVSAYPRRAGGAA